MKLRDILRELDMPKDVYEYYMSSNRLDEDVSLPDPIELDNLVRFLKCISNPIRLSILMLLSKPHCVCILTKLLNQDKTLISHHLAKLRECGLVSETPLARARIYRRNDDKLKKMFGKLLSLLETMS